MISHRRKIITASAVLIAGLLIAWPFRRSGETLPQPDRTMIEQVADPLFVGPSLELNQPAPMQRLAGPVRLQEQPERPQSFVATDSLPSTLASVSVSSSSASDVTPLPLTSLPVNGPTIGGYAPELVTKPQAVRAPAFEVQATGPRPVYAIAARPQLPNSDSARESRQVLSPLDDTPEIAHDLRIHVVHNGDTLERLAKRYLNDERRALEIFDMNRETLTNPHLLPIGAEIVIPSRELPKPIEARGV